MEQKWKLICQIQKDRRFEVKEFVIKIWELGKRKK